MVTPLDFCLLPLREGGVERRLRGNTKWNAPQLCLIGTILVPPKLHDLFPRIRVPASFLLAAFYFYYSRPSWKSLALGGCVGFLGLMMRAWATGHLRKNDRLAVSGPYTLTRNPLYFGSFLIGIGFSLAGRDINILVVFLLCFAVLYGPVMQREIETMRHLFAEQYSNYEERVPLFFPRLHR